MKFASIMITRKVKYALEANIHQPEIEANPMVMASQTIAILFVLVLA